MTDVVPVAVDRLLFLFGGVSARGSVFSVRLVVGGVLEDEMRLAAVVAVVLMGAAVRGTQVLQCKGGRVEGWVWGLVAGVFWEEREGKSKDSGAFSILLSYEAVYSCN